MRKTKRLIALLTVALFMLSIAAPGAFAATKEEAYGRLNALSVAVGNEAGDPMYDGDFTRAQSAAIMVNLLGMKAAIPAAKGATKFSDVPASHWASGVINLAVGAGVIKGFPDGKFRPDDKVSYAQMSAMLVQVLGYGPKLQGVWPSNVIGKAAQLGLLDGLTVTDYNAAAIRANVFLAADNALDTKPLKETKDGYEEDTKTLMVAKLSVTKYAKAAVTGTPYFTGIAKDKITVGADTLTVGTGVNPNDFYGLEVEAWTKDDKVFFLNVKTDASNIISDKIKYFNGDTAGTAIQKIGATTAGTRLASGSLTSIYLDGKDKSYTLAASPTLKYNYADLSDTNTLPNEAAIKIILDSDGKAKYVLATGKADGMVDSIDTSNEKITMKSDSVVSGSTTIELKDKKVILTKNGKTAALADIKKGDVVSFISSGDVRLIEVSDTVKSGKLTSVANDGTRKADGLPKFKFSLDSDTISSAKYVKTSTNDEKDFGTEASTVSDFSSVLGKDVKVKLNSGGKAVYIIATSAASASEIPVLVSNIKKVVGTTTARWLYVNKFDGSAQLYYEVTKDTKIDGFAITENAGGLKEPNGPILTANGKTVKVGDIVKISLTTDGKVNEIKTYGADLLNSAYAQNISVNKDNDTINAASSGVKVVNSDTKILKVKTYAASAADELALNINGSSMLSKPFTGNVNKYVDEAETATWASVEATTTVQQSNSYARLVKDGGYAKFIVVYDDKATLDIASNWYFGLLLDTGSKDVNGTSKSYAKLSYTNGKDSAKDEDIVGSTVYAKKDVVRFKLDSKGELGDQFKFSPVAETVSGNAYVTFKVDSISSDGRQLKLYFADTSFVDYNGATKYDYFLIDATKTQFYNVDATPIATGLKASDVTGKYVNIYDMWDQDGNYKAGGDGVIDFVVVVKK